MAWFICINKEAPHTVCDNPNSLHGGDEVKTIAEIKIYSNREEALKAAEEEKEKLMREAVEKEVQRLKMQENEKKEANSFESGKDNEG